MSKQIGSEQDNGYDCYNFSSDIVVAVKNLMSEFGCEMSFHYKFALKIGNSKRMQFGGKIRHIPEDYDLPLNEDFNLNRTMLKSDREDHCGTHSCCAKVKKAKKVLFSG